MAPSLPSLAAVRHAPTRLLYGRPVVWRPGGAPRPLLLPVIADGTEEDTGAHLSLLRGYGRSRGSRFIAIGGGCCCDGREHRCAGPGVSSQEEPPRDSDAR